jgi:hypothetical protein
MYLCHLPGRGKLDESRRQSKREYGNHDAELIGVVDRKRDFRREDLRLQEKDWQLYCGKGGFERYAFACSYGNGNGSLEPPADALG